MVKLSEPNNEELVICDIRCRPIKVLLLSDLSEELKDPSLKKDAFVDAYVDIDNGDVFLWQEGWEHVAALNAEEFQVREGWDRSASLDLIEDETIDTEEEEAGAEPEADTDGDTDKAAPVEYRDTWPKSWEAEALQEIKEARVHVAMMECLYLEAKERAKDAKANWEEAVSKLTQVIDATTKPLPLFDQAPAKNANSTPVDANDADPSEGPTEDTAWRTEPIDVLFTDVDRLGDKKKQAIRDVCPTLGAFEDLRRKASLQGDPLKEFMPNGIGQAICDQLEEAVLNWLQSHQGGSNGDSDG